MAGLARRALGWLGMVPGQVLQIAEVAVAAGEHARAAALEGLDVRYLPSRLVVGVSGEDLRVLSRFERELAAAVRNELERIAAEPGWSSPGAVEVSLEAGGGLASGDAPVIRSSFPPASTTARYRSRRRSGGPPPGAPAAATIELIFTGGGGEGTAAQERIRVAFGPWAPAGFPDPAAAGNGSPAAGAEATQAAHAPDDERAPSSAATLGPRRAPEIAPAVVSRLPAGWDRPWFETEIAPGKGRVVWVPGKVAVVGRERGTAHVVPNVPASVLSRSHLAMWLRDDGSLALEDLGSTNGTFVIGTQVAAGGCSLSVPCRFDIGREGRLVIEVRLEEA